jgi:4-hydroxybenzoate polyprenyltransferase
VLVSLVTMALASLAGGSIQVVVLLGGAMLALQSSIGATNDLADRVEDRRRGARKPIPADQIGVPAATAVSVLGALVGLALAALAGPVVVLVGGIGLLAGIAYDLWLRARGLEVVAYAIALPALLVFAWWGAAGTLPPGDLALLALAAMVGPSLYLANSLVDVELDVLERAPGLVARLGQRGAVLALAFLVVTTHALAWILWAGTDRPTGATIAMLVGGITAVVGVALSAQVDRGRRSMGWAAQALATAALGVGIVAALAGETGPGASS